jgi:Flp pilus assembly protein TadD
MKSGFLTIAIILLLGTNSASAEFDEAIQNNNAGVELLKQGKYGEATASLLKAVELNPKDSNTRLNLAYAYDRQGRYEEAVVQYQKVVELNPRNPIARNNLGVLYDRMGRYYEAIRELEKVVELDPRNPDGPKNLETARKNQARIQERDKQIAEALRNTEAQPQDPNVSYRVARTYAFYGKKDEAIGWLEKALKEGYSDIGYVKTDPALQSLREEPDYIWLLRGR